MMHEVGLQTDILLYIVSTAEDTTLHYTTNLKNTVPFLATTCLSTASILVERLLEKDECMLILTAFCMGMDWLCLAVI